MRIALWVVCLSCFLLSGCAFMDALFGYSETYEDGTPVPPSEAVGSLLNMFIPGAAAVLSLVGNLYQALRGRKWKKAGQIAFQAIEEHKDSDIGKKIKAKCKENHMAMNLYKLLKPYFDSMGHKSK